MNHLLSCRAGGWSPLVTDQEPWLQVDLREQMEVTAVATQGRYDSWDWVRSYVLLYSDTGRGWKQYRQEDGVGVTDPLHKTRFLRFVPFNWNPSGWMGLRVEVYGCAYKSYVADFDGRSSLLYRFNQKSMSTVKDVISLRFKSQQAEGVLLHGEGQRGDYITLELHRGRLDFYLNLDDSSSSRQRFSSSRRVAVTVGSLLDDQHWHTVVIERFNKQVNLSVDSHTHHFATRGEGQSLEVDYELSFGGIPLPGKPGTFLRKNFHGCMENLYYNGINIIDLAKRRKPQIHSVSFYVVSPVGHALNDGLWHAVRLDTKNLQITLSVDKETPSTVELWEKLEIKGNLYFGGCPAVECQRSTPAFQGCMQLIFINNQTMDLSHVQQGLLGNYNELQFHTCNIRDRCLPNLCEHGGRCSQTWSSFSCDCSGTGYSGATCHNSIYEASCEAYKLIGSSSGFYSIDPDGSGPLGPTQVYCNMTEERVWTVITHNSTAPLTIQGSSVLKPHIVKLNYSTTSPQLQAIVEGSEHCQQEVVYNCRRSRLFNTKDGSPLSWWLDRSGERRSYWGGFLPGVQQCSCSLEENCVDMNYFCNCDADRDTWANDSGVLSYKEHLPVTQIVIGDTNRTGAQAVLHVEPLRCYGDKTLWNAASFYQESSYLYFPTLQAELASDISFYFKTSSPSGVFLENLGLKHFIRVELSSPSLVTFSFDVGNGPAVLSVKSHLPLNDRQWHYVRAERNVKEASLQVDQLPLRFMEAPAEGYLRLRLSSQLFVGGFLGCIRTLIVNGVNFDLEERAKMTPGVSSGCPGYCSGSSSLCHNRGRCIEKSSGYICDCSQSAYGGTTCDQGETHSLYLLTYAFQEPFSVMQNGNSPASSVSTESLSRAREDMAFSFSTTHTPAMLLTLSTHSQQYIAITLAKNGSLQIWYHLKKSPHPDVLSPSSSNLADGRLHRIRINRVSSNVYVQVGNNSHKLIYEVRQAASRGFVGCLSSVQFNHVAPLKAALTNRGSSLVTIRGPLVQSNCGVLADSASHTMRGRELYFSCCFYMRYQCKPKCSACDFLLLLMSVRSLFPFLGLWHYIIRFNVQLLGISLFHYKVLSP
uniref:Contactin associated protein-like 5a n=1 Tax=Neogobius melanostomus TaxID=47308 RepID=A0A8C6TKU7_9GOBI